MSDHYIIKCKCGNVLAQCRCIGFDKKIETRESCDQCKPQSNAAAATKPS